jgi:hypothetical protein
MVWLKGCAMEKVNCTQIAKCCSWSDPPCGASCRLLIFWWCVLVCLTSGAVASFGDLGPIYKLQLPDKAALPSYGFLHDLHNYVGRVKIVCSSLWFSCCLKKYCEWFAQLSKVKLSQEIFWILMFCRHVLHQLTVNSLKKSNKKVNKQRIVEKRSRMINKRQMYRTKIIPFLILFQ